VATKGHSPKAGIPRVTIFAATVIVADRGRSVEYYTSNLGLDVVQDLGHWVTVGRKGSNGLIHLCQGSEIGFPLEPGNVGITIHVPGDFVKSCAALEKNGVKFVRPPKKESWGWWARITDPDGNELTLNPAEQ
jgi:predicted enzyme related to lactoylglutathione lyase